MSSRRQRQVAELLHEEISQLIQFNTQDPRLGFVTVTGVDVTPEDVESVRRALPDCQVSWWAKPQIEYPSRRRRGG